VVKKRLKYDRKIKAGNKKGNIIPSRFDVAFAYLEDWYFKKLKKALIRVTA